MGSNYSIKYNIDIVMVIDATGSMDSLIGTVKNNALTFYDDLTASMARKAKHVDQVRVRVIAFRDYIADKEPMLASDFFNLPDDSAAFEELLKGIKADGGGDDEEDGLEALAYAMKSHWNTAGDKLRHIIIVWSDDGTHKLGFGATAPTYPRKMAKDFEELTEWWGDEEQEGIMNKSAKRLLIYAPEKKYWSTISDSWDQVVHFPSEAGKGLKSVEYDQILDAITNSI